MEWKEIEQLAIAEIGKRKLPDEYRTRLDKELYEIVKQGANAYWTEQYNNHMKWDSNPNGLVFPWVLNMTPVDPIKDGFKHVETYQTDFPDIDLDFLPFARQTIKEHAVQTYTHVCSVGNWITYKPKSAMQDVARALGGNIVLVMQLTSVLPDEFDELTLEDHDKFFKDLENPDPKIRADAHIEIGRYQTFYDFKQANPDLVDIAFRLVGKIKAQGTHAGGVIIADRPIENIVPLSLMGGSGEKQWTSQWTEGKKTQLSKFGLVKFDILGVKTIYYIWQAGNLIKKSRGITVDWSHMDPLADPPYMGVEKHPDGTESYIHMNDEVSLAQCNEQRVDSIFQIETPIQKRIISDGKVRRFWDLVVYNALGRPGPMDEIPNYIRRRDDPLQTWKNNEDERIVKILDNTFGTIVYQEQLQAMWSSLAGFTVPEAEAARKIISKKWVDKLPQVEAQWKKGAVKTVGEKIAAEWWDKMVTFGRYAFNKSHSVAYSIITYRCLYLKAHYPEEWWAAVMTECQPYKLSTYMSAARLEGTKFGNLDVDNLTVEYTVKDGKVLPGLISIKGIGENAAKQFVSTGEKIRDIDHFVVRHGKSKKVIERLIKLGAFDKLHPNRQGLWGWYQYTYCSGTDVTTLKKAIAVQVGWSDEKIQEQRRRFAADYIADQEAKRARLKKPPKNPKPIVVPKKIQNWKPKIEVNRQQVIDLFEDYTPGQRLKMEKEFLGYYWSSPLDMYVHDSENSIENAKTSGKMDVVIETVVEKRARKSGNAFYVLKVTDGVQNTDVTVWADVYHATDPRIFRPGVGVRIIVDYSEDRKNFKIQTGTTIVPLVRTDSSQAVEFAPVKSDDLNIW